MAPLVRTGGSRHTGLAAPPHRNIQRGESTPSAEFMLRISKYFNMMVEDVFHVEN